MEYKIETSARHIHLSAEDFKLLFGDKEPTKLKELSQSDFSCEEMMEVIGPKSSIKKVRLLVPFRDNSQLELSRTDCFALGVDAPLKISGDLPGANIKVIGPVGSIEKEIAIVAKRHLHIPLETATGLGLSDNDIVEAKISGDRGVTFSNVIVRTKGAFKPAVHIDTDEANAAGIGADATCELIFNS